MIVFDGVENILGKGENAGHQSGVNPRFIGKGLIRNHVILTFFNPVPKNPQNLDLSKLKVFAVENLCVA